MSCKNKHFFSFIKIYCTILFIFYGFGYFLGSK